MIGNNTANGKPAPRTEPPAPIKGTPAAPKWRGVYGYDSDGWTPGLAEFLPVGDVEQTMRQWGYHPAGFQIGDDTTPVFLELFAGTGDFAAYVTIGKKAAIVQCSDLPALLGLLRELEPLLALMRDHKDAERSHLFTTLSYQIEDWEGRFDALETKVESIEEALP